MKLKIGTQLEEEVYHELKRRAAEERQPISELIQTAVVDYLHRAKGSRRKSGLARMLERPPLKVTDEQFREIMELDYFDQ